MAKKRTTLKKARTLPADKDRPSGYQTVLSDAAKLIADSRRRALATVNRELVLLYWQIGVVIVHQQATAHWGDSVVEQPAPDLRAEFPDMKGFTKDNLFRMRKFVVSCRKIDLWLAGESTQVVTAKKDANPSEFVGTVSRQFASSTEPGFVATLSPQSPEAAAAIVGKACPQLNSTELGRDLAFVGKQYPLTVGGDTFHIDLLFFHRRLQCLAATDLRVSGGKEYIMTDQVDFQTWFTNATGHMARRDSQLEVRADATHRSVMHVRDKSRRQPDVNLRKVPSKTALPPQYLPRPESRGFVHLLSECCPVHRSVREAARPLSFLVAVLGRRAKAGKRQPAYLREGSLLRRKPQLRSELVQEFPYLDCRTISWQNQDRRPGESTRNRWLNQSNPWPPFLIRGDSL